VNIQDTKQQLSTLQSFWQKPLICRPAQPNIQTRNTLFEKTKFRNIVFNDYDLAVKVNRSPKRQILCVNTKSIQ
jgi:hypothetical protein